MQCAQRWAAAKHYHLNQREHGRQRQGVSADSDEDNRWDTVYSRENTEESCTAGSTTYKW